uniref:JmjC domain-containing protein n=1 Tax=Timema monikensis TaxID=170555 RepID=A0A7R9HN36_9NEOP|nr:unnamed protein product [Timema monikensis]
MYCGAVQAVERVGGTACASVEERLPTEHFILLFKLFSLLHQINIKVTSFTSIISGNIRETYKEWYSLQEYAHANWNLNNLPVQDGSVLKHINADISGMKIPWMYVGMCFATFCWHNEDHWSYSINYMHWLVAIENMGEPKTWYGVPGNKADNFESAMKMAAPELFQLQPDLLHQLVTIMNPNILMNAETNKLGDTDSLCFVYQQLFVRFTKQDSLKDLEEDRDIFFSTMGEEEKLKIGRECIAQYALLRRFCVFSHDELVCKMAVDPESLDMALAAATYNDMIQMVVAEKHIRNSLQEWKVQERWIETYKRDENNMALTIKRTQFTLYIAAIGQRALLNFQGALEAEREAFELIPEDERQCKVCKTTCFLSAVTCICDSEHLVCLQHYANLCDCPPEKHTLRYRYTLEELPQLMEKLKIRAESFKRWFEAVSSCLEGHPKQKMDLADLKILLFEAENDKFPESELFEKLRQTVQKAEKCEIVAKQLATRKLRNSMLTTMIAKLQEKSPLKQKAVRGLSSLDPCVIQHSPQLAQKRFSFLLEELNHANIINDVLAENAKKEYLHFCNLKKSELQEIFRPCDQFSDEVGLDTIYGSFLIGEANYKHLWEVIKICLVLSHGNATVEGGFSVNKSLLVENMHEKTVIAQRHIHDEIQEAGGIKNIHISKKMLDYVRGARKRYHEYLEMKKQERSEEGKTKAEKRKLDIQV